MLPSPLVDWGLLPKNMKILLANGPNLNLLGSRETDIYGHRTLADIEDGCRAFGKELGLEVACFQSNSEGALIDRIHESRQDCAGIIINPGGFTHTSVALLDALLASDLPVVEVHLSNIHQREEFRHRSYVSKAASGVICGFGAYGYRMALEAMARLVKQSG
jgi:3-dehydroquinate dehydratase-2